MPVKFTRTYTLDWTPPGIVARKNSRGGKQVYKSGSAAIEALGTNMSTLPYSVIMAAEALVSEAATEHSRRARELAPKDTGFMDSTFEHTGAKTTGLYTYAESSVEAPYAAFQEYGFHHWRNGRFVRPRAFMFPAFVEVQARFMDRVRRLFK